MSTGTRLEVGAKAPNFEVVDQDSRPVSLADFHGQKFILYFYPTASTPSCSKEAWDFNDNLKDFKEAGYTIVGISPDETAKLIKFKENQDLKFSLLSDPDLKTHKAYAAFGTKSMYGRTYEGVIRSTFAIDENGKIILALYNVKSTGHVKMLRRLLGI